MHLTDRRHRRERLAVASGAFDRDRGHRLDALVARWGLLFSARETGTRLRPAWWLDLHKWLGGLALVFTAVHLVVAFADSDLACVHAYQLGSDATTPAFVLVASPVTSWRRSPASCAADRVVRPHS